MSIRIRHLEIPDAVRAGNEAKLTCDYDLKVGNLLLSLKQIIINEMKTKKLICINNLQGQTLQTLKWYKGTYEFYRYEPGNYPEQKKFFSLPELYLDVSIGMRKM